MSADGQGAEPKDVPSHHARRAELFPGVPDAQWNDWRWQMRNSVRDGQRLGELVTLTDEERGGIERTRSIFRMGISPYYLSLIDPSHPFCPVRMQAIPNVAEATINVGELRDPLGEDPVRPVEAIVHKYPDRVLFLALDSCSVYCRHCTRRRITKGGEAELSTSAMAEGIHYIRSRPEVRDVLISGGDPLLLSEERLETLLTALRAIPHVELIRIGTRLPVCLPMRITDSLAVVLRRFAPLFVITHFNHAKELTPEARQACERLVDHGVPVENQAVLMRRLNSDARIIKELNHECLKARVRPYYLHQMDVAEGLEHLRTPIETGLKIIEQLRGWTSGLAVPHLAVDLPGGGGKVTLQRDPIIERRASETILRSYRGVPYAYPEPKDDDCSCPYERVWRSDGARLGR